MMSGTNNYESLGGHSATSGEGIGGKRVMNIGAIGKVTASNYNYFKQARKVNRASFRLS